VIPVLNKQEEMLAFLDEGPLSPAAEKRPVPQFDHALRHKHKRPFAQSEVRSPRAQAVDGMVDRFAETTLRYAGLETAIVTPSRWVL
jgi:hypothetical protein